MRVFDISMPIEAGMARYPGDPDVAIEPWTRRRDGDEFDVSLLRMGTHTGTHVDAPSHCIEGGATVEALVLDVLCGPAYVLEPAGEAEALRDAFARLPAGYERLLLKMGRQGARPRPPTWNDAARPFGSATPNSGGAAARISGGVRTEGAARGLSEADAAALGERGIRLVGIDRLSIAVAAEELAVHRRLLAAGVVIVEGLVLEQVAPGAYDLYCLPLLLMGADGAPVRAILVER